MYQGYGCLVQVGNGIELEAVGLQFEPYLWLPCVVTWDLSRTVVVIKMLRTSALWARAQDDEMHPVKELSQRMYLMFLVPPSWL